MEDRLDAAAAAIRSGELVVYPTETVYGLGADALDPEAIARVYDAKRRSQMDPLSLAVPDVDAAMAFVHATDPARECMSVFLPGPVTVVCEKSPVVPDELTSGLDRVGVRVPDHEIALALLGRVAPITSTSANMSGRGGITRVTDLDPTIRETVAVVVDGGETPGTASTVVDPDRGEILRRGAMANDVEAWLARR